MDISLLYKDLTIQVSFNQHRQIKQLQQLLLNEFQPLLQGLQKTALLCDKLPSSVHMFVSMAALLRDSSSSFFFPNDLLAKQKPSSLSWISVGF